MAAKYHRYLSLIITLYLALLCFIYYNLDREPRHRYNVRPERSVINDIKTGNIFSGDKKRHIIDLTTESTEDLQTGRDSSHTERQDKKSTCEQLQGNSFINVSNFFVFSAFYDDRRHRKSFVRLIVLRHKNDSRHLWCGFYNDSSTYLVKTHAYRMCENHDMSYGGWIYSCQVPGFLLSPICHVSLAVSVQDFRDRNTVDITVTSININVKSRRTFGVCVPPLFDISVQTLTQFVELSRIFGASLFTFYIHNISKQTMKALQYYERKGIAVLIPWKLPMNLTDSQIWYHGQLLTIQDCLYRNMNQVKFATFVDLDEFIVPKMAHDWFTLVNNLEATSKVKPDQIAGFSFSSAFFPSKKPQNIYYNMPVLLFFKHVTQLSKRRSKVMVRPEKIFELGIHHVSRPIKDHYKILLANKTQAFIHHYRSCVADPLEQLRCIKEHEDRTLLRYAEILENNYLTALREIKLFSL